MLNLNFKKWFSKGEEDLTITPKEISGRFILKVDNIKLGTLKHENGMWIFEYTDEFKKLEDTYKPIVGFPDINKIYSREMLWPFFLIRIPGLKQPAIREIIEKENIDKNNEVELLARFGRKSTANPYELLPD